MSTTHINYWEWFPFAFIIVGVILMLIAPILPHNKQRREKSMKLLSTFRTSLHEHDMNHWKVIYFGTRESASAPAGHFMSVERKPVPLDTMWTTGNDDHTAVQRMAEYLEILCTEMLTHTVDIKMMWYEIGQLLDSMHAWLEEIPGVQKDLTFLEEQYPSIKQVFEKYGHRFKRWPYRIYAER